MIQKKHFSIKIRHLEILHSYQIHVSFVKVVYTEEAKEQNILRQSLDECLQSVNDLETNYQQAIIQNNKLMKLLEDEKKETIDSIASIIII